MACNLPIPSPLTSSGALLALCLFGISSLPAQERDTTANDAQLQELLQEEPARPYVEFKGNFGAISTGMSSANLYQLATDDYLDHREKEQLLSGIGEEMRFGFERLIEINYRQPGYRVLDRVRHTQGFSIRNRYLNTGRLHHRALDLVFFGNAPFQDETLNIGKSGYETWYYTSLDYQFGVVRDSSWQLTLATGLQMGHDHQSIQLNQASLYTAPLGQYLDLDLDYRLRSQIEGGSALAGLGASLGAELNILLSRQWNLEATLQDFGLIYWTNGRQLDTDTNFRFGGVLFDNIFEINDSLTSRAGDRYRQALLYRDQEPYMSLLPFRLSARLHYKMSGRLKRLSLAADYRYLPGFWPRVSAQAQWQTGFNQHLTTAVAGGGFTWFSLDIGYSFHTGRYWQWQILLYNANGLLAPEWFGGAMGQVQLRVQL